MIVRCEECKGSGVVPKKLGKFAIATILCPRCKGNGYYNRKFKHIGWIIYYPKNEKTYGKILKNRKNAINKFTTSWKYHYNKGYRCVKVFVEK